MQKSSDKSWLWLSAGLAMLLAMWAVWGWIRPELSIELGSPGGFSSGHVRFLAVWVPMGLASVVMLSTGLRGTRERLAAVAIVGTHRDWIVGLSGLALLCGLLCHVFVLQMMPVTDDESAYLFAARLLVHGQLSVPPAPEKLFWDRAFMVNDGAFYSQYFLGWPALLAPFAWLEVPGLANSVYFALTVPAWYGLMLRASGRGWARAATVAFVLSPMAIIAAGTQMAHTAELLLMCWAIWAGLRSLDDDHPWWAGAVFGFCFAGAFFNRPLTALALGLPILGLFVWRGLRQRHWRVLLAFSVPAVGLAVLFLTVNQLQNGSPTSVAYQRALMYAVENRYRFSHLPEGTVIPAVANFHFRDPAQQVRMLLVGVGRLTFASWGWPLVLPVFAFLPWSRGSVRFYGATVACFLLLHLGVSVPGVDTFGPAHFFEAVLPLSALLAALFHERTRSQQTLLGLRPWPLFVAAVIVNVAFYSPVRMITVHQITTDVRRAPDVGAGVSNAIVYVPLIGWSPQCTENMPKYFLFWRPNPRPDFSDDVLFANHLSASRDRAHRGQYFPDRKGYILVTSATCELSLVDLASPQALSVADGNQTVPLP